MTAARCSSTIPEPPSRDRVARARTARRLGIGLLALSSGSARSTSSVSGATRSPHLVGGYELTVTYAAMSRPRPGDTPLGRGGPPSGRIRWPHHDCHHRALLETRCFGWSGSPRQRCSMPPGSRGSKTWMRSGSASSRQTGSSPSSLANATRNRTGRRNKGYVRSNRMARLTSWMAFVTWMPRGQASVQLKVVRHRNTPVRSPRILRRSSAPRSRES